MRPRTVPGWVSLVLILTCLAPGVAPARDAPPSDEADKKFASMLAAAKAAPEKADFKALRHAFAETSSFKPYSDWRKEIAAVREQVRRGETKEAEAALEKLMDREGFMRIDGHGLATVLYKRTGQKEKLDLHTGFAKGIAATIFVPGTGLGVEKPIEVLFVDEEYHFLESLKYKRKRQALEMHEDHWIDVLETEPREGEESQKFYFNIDLPHKSLEKMLGRFKAKKEGQ